MRSTACAIALLMLNSTAFAQSDVAPKVAKGIVREAETYCPWTHPLEGVPEEEHWLDGVILNSKVKMYLHRAGADVVGLFYSTDGDWTPTFLGGEWNGNKITLSAEAADQAPKGRLEAQFVNGALIGSWTPEGSDQAEPVQLATVRKTACDGSGAWKRFDDPKWPVSFSYPASWHIKQVDDALQLICPDPEEMAYDNAVSIHEGKVQEAKPVGIWELVHCANGWRFGRSCAKSEGNMASLSVSTVSQQPDRTILNVESEWRVYCTDGGYVGLGEGDDRVVVLPNNWIEILGGGSASELVDRIVNTVKSRTVPTVK